MGAVARLDVEVRERRAAGVAVRFDPLRLALARRLRGLRRTELADLIRVTPAAVSQFERGQTRPTLPLVAAMSLALGVPAEFFTLGRSLQPGSASSPHFRSLRTTSQLQRDRALAFAELAADVVTALEQHVELPHLLLPDLRAPEAPDLADIAQLAAEARVHFELRPGPVPHVVRMLEAAGVLVLRLPEISQTVDAFSAHLPTRPVVLLNPAKGDAARARFDSAHELAHLVMHFDAAPGSRIVEKEADSFAAEFLMPADEIVDELPRRLDWEKLHHLKQRWGVSLKALVYRAHHLGVLTPNAYRRGMQQLNEWGYPEPGPLSAIEVPTLMQLTFELLEKSGYGVDQVADELHLPVPVIAEILKAGSDPRPQLRLA
ncbi:ImmA/IrrE family metallo-endopeptidase [Kribbella sp. NPDC056861]|uniref:ImmA/IrrE family metallo-endopeptidase n=1 Tax=Kribbella sp. NPDC056861 TaxID=3154857 RepID=UPI00342F2AB6